MGVLRLDASMPHSTLQLQLVSDLPDVLRAIVAMRLQHWNSAPMKGLKVKRIGLDRAESESNHYLYD